MDKTTKPTAAQIVNWLREKMGDGRVDGKMPFFIEHDYANGSTECGFTSEFSVDFDELEREMNAWIGATFANNTSEGGATAPTASESPLQPCPPSCARVR